MTQFVEMLNATFSRPTVWSIVDILVVAVLFYGFLSLLRGTSAFSVLYGIALLLIAVGIVSGLPNLVVLNWLLTNALPVLSLALIVVFQPELRRAMERVGRVRGLLSSAAWLGRQRGHHPSDQRGFSGVPPALRTAPRRTDRARARDRPTGVY